MKYISEGEILKSYKEKSTELLKTMLQILTRVYRKIEDKPYREILTKIANNPDESKF